MSKKKTTTKADTALASRVDLIRGELTAARVDSYRAISRLNDRVLALEEAALRQKPEPRRGLLARLIARIRGR